MKYDNIRKGIFKKRPNRFIAHVELNGEEVICHVKNTGRCRELLIPGVSVGLVYSDNPARKTRYDVVSVEKDGRWVNMDSQMANDVAEEWIRKGQFFSPDALVRREVRFGGSRFDFYIEEGERKSFLEVKGVTLEEAGIARFPDAPTTRGVKHLQELEAAMEGGFNAYVLFVIQMKGVEKFCPNWNTHREFAQALCHAREAGVKLLAWDCQVEMGSITLDAPVDIQLEEE